MFGVARQNLLVCLFIVNGSRIQMRWHIESERIEIASEANAIRNLSHVENLQTHKYSEIKWEHRIQWSNWNESHIWIVWFKAKLVHSFAVNKNSIFGIWEMFAGQANSVQRYSQFRGDFERQNRVDLECHLTINRFGDGSPTIASIVCSKRWNERAE